MSKHVKFQGKTYFPWPKDDTNTMVEVLGQEAYNHLYVDDGTGEPAFSQAEIDEAVADAGANPPEVPPTNEELMDMFLASSPFEQARTKAVAKLLGITNAQMKQAILDEF